MLACFFHLRSELQCLEIQFNEIVETTLLKSEKSLGDPLALLLVILRESYTPHKWWISCEYMRLPRLRSLPAMNQNRSTILGFWAMNIEVTQQNTEHLWSATVDPTWTLTLIHDIHGTRPWRPSLLLVHGLRSPGTNPGNSMEAPRFP